MTPDMSWIAVSVVGAGIAILGLVNMGKSAFMGWLMLAFAAIFFFVAWKQWKHGKQSKK